VAVQNYRNTVSALTPDTERLTPNAFSAVETLHSFFRVQSPMLVTMIAAALSLALQAETWELKPSFDPKAPKQVWAMIVDTEADGDNHHATFNLTRVTKSVKPEKTVDSFKWEKLLVDDHEGQETDPWDIVVGPRGELLKMDSENEDTYRRMLSPLVFIYPEKPVSLGDKWSVEVKPTVTGAKITYDYEAKSKELVDGINTVVVALTLKEAGVDATNGEGFWWLSKVGKVVKFEMRLENWVVPMAGTQPMNVVIKGKAQ